MSKLVYLVPLFPLIGFLINGLARKSLSKSLTGIIGSGVILASFIVSVILFFEVKAGPYVPVAENERAKWAPSEGDESVAIYREWMRSLFD